MALKEDLVGAEADKLKRNLRDSGLSDQGIEAAWPTWWSDQASQLPSAKAELRFSLARRLGLSPRSLFEDRVEFVWKDEARFKHLSGQLEAEKAALTSFGISVGRLLIQASTSETLASSFAALAIRRSILKTQAFVDLQSLVAFCWAVGIPVLHLRVFPLKAKRMHAMVVRLVDRYAIMLGRDAQYPAPVAFSLAHELGHIALGHVANASALIEVEDPATSDVTDDDDETAADAFALALLTGTSSPDIQTNGDEFGAAQLAGAAIKAGSEARIEPGTLALCYGHISKEWAKANAALRFIYSEAKPVWKEVNTVAATQLFWSALGEDGAEYLRAISGIEHEQGGAAR